MLTTYPVSPCVKKCKLTADLLCEGCGRSIEEIQSWRLMTAEQKREVWLRLQGNPPRGGSPS